MHKIRQWEVFLGRLLGPLLKIGLPVMKNLLKQLAKGILKPLGLTAAVSATDSAIHNKNVSIRFDYNDKLKQRNA